MVVSKDKWWTGNGAPPSAMPGVTSMSSRGVAEGAVGGGESHAARVAGERNMEMGV